MNPFWTALVNAFTALFKTADDLSPGLNAWIEAKVKAKQGLWNERAMKRRFRIALRELKKNPVKDVKTLVGLDFNDLDSTEQAEAVTWLTECLSFKK